MPSFHKAWLRSVYFSCIQFLFIHMYFFKKSDVMFASKVSLLASANDNMTYWVTQATAGLSELTGEWVMATMVLRCLLNKQPT